SAQKDGPVELTIVHISKGPEKKKKKKSSKKHRKPSHWVSTRPDPPGARARLKTPHNCGVTNEEAILQPEKQGLTASPQPPLTAGPPGEGADHQRQPSPRATPRRHFRQVLGEFLHPCEDDIVCKCTTDENKVPYFNAPVYLENKEQIGKVDEIFGQLRDFYFSVKLSENMKASSFKKLQKFYIDPYKLLPLQRFLPRPPGEKGPPRGGGRGGRGGGRGGGGRGGRGGGFRGGRGGGGFRGGRGGGGFRGRGH
uniref:H/ACA ribonucleoprotein complex subunit n=1 Tax=Felis catus TaxID=9685 RepID=A0ABI7ZDB5_FELCA